MAKRRSLTPLGETEMEVLNHVWDLGQGTVTDIRQQILKKRNIAYTTVMTVLKNLADKGYLTYTIEGNAYLYRARRSQEDVRRNLVGDLVGKVFKGSRLAMIQTLVQDEHLTDAELEQVKNLIRQMEEGESGGGVTGEEPK